RLRPAKDRKPQGSTVSRRVAPLASGLAAVISVASAVLLALGPAQPLPGDAFAGVGGAAFIMLSLTFAGVGAILVWRVPGNRIGRIFCIIGVFNAATLLAWLYADYVLNASSRPLPGAAFAAAFPGEPLAPF